MYSTCVWLYWTYSYETAVTPAAIVGRDFSLRCRYIHLSHGGSIDFILFSLHLYSYVLLRLFYIAWFYILCFKCFFIVVLGFICMHAFSLKCIYCMLTSYRVPMSFPSHASLQQEDRGEYRSRLKYSSKETAWEHCKKQEEKGTPTTGSTAAATTQSTAVHHRSRAEFRALPGCVSIGSYQTPGTSRRFYMACFYSTEYQWNRRCVSKRRPRECESAGEALCTTEDIRVEPAANPHSWQLRTFYSILNFYSCDFLPCVFKGHW